MRGRRRRVRISQWDSDMITCCMETWTNFKISIKIAPFAKCLWIVLLMCLGEFTIELVCTWIDSILSTLPFLVLHLSNDYSYIYSINYIQNNDRKWPMLLLYMVKRKSRFTYATIFRFWPDDWWIINCVRMYTRLFSLYLTTTFIHFQLTIPFGYLCMETCFYFSKFYLVQSKAHELHQFVFVFSFTHSHYP